MKAAWLMLTGAVTLTMAQTPTAWNELAPLPIAAAGGVTGVVNGAFVYAGGTTWNGGVKRWMNEVFRYQGGKWSAGPSLPQPLAYGAAVNAGGTLEIFGGAGETTISRGIWRLEANAWKPMGETPADTIFAKAAVVGGKTYLFGGCSSQTDLTQCSDSVYARDAAGKWARVSKLPHGNVAMPAGAVAGDRVFLFGGCSMAPGAPLINRSDAWSYDPAKDAWRKLRPLPHAVRGMTALARDANHILLLGGYTTDFTAAMFLYDVKADTYTHIGNAPLAAAGIEALLYDGEVLLIGGEPRMKERSAKVFRGR